jgi:putative ABC transport system permease protein
MFKNYFVIALRNIFKRKLFSVINILGLSLSMSAGLLIILMLFDQLQYDRFHANEDRIYRVITRANNSSSFIATSPIPLKNTLLEEYEGIDKVVRFRNGLGGDITYEDYTLPLAGYYTDEDFFDVFGFTLESGDPKTALKAPFSMVLSKEAANRMFKDEDALGKVVSFNDRGMNMLGFDLDVKDILLGDFTITGIVEDNGKKTHINFDILVSMSTLESLINSGIENEDMNDWKDVWNTHVYLLASEGKTEIDLNRILDNIATVKYESFENFTAEFELQPLSKISPGKMLGNPMNLRMPLEGFYFLSFLAVIIILSACFNYTNLTIVRSLSRMKEIALRKINGAYRLQIFSQFTVEAIIISLIALIISIFILQLIKPGFSGLWINKYMTIGLGENVFVYMIFIVFSILIGVIAGIIPAWILSAFKPLNMLSNKLTGSINKKGVFIFKKPMLGRSLVVIQLVLSLFFIITSTLLFMQLKHFGKAEYGFNKENIINIHLRGNDHNLLASEFSTWSDVKRISASSIMPATLVKSGKKIYKLDETQDSLLVYNISVDHNFIQNLGIEILAGTDYHQDVVEENKRFILLNETAARKFGYQDNVEVLGEKFSTVHSNVAKGSADETVEVIGVVKDFHYDIFVDHIEPFMFTCKPEDYRYLNIKVAGQNLNETVAFLKTKWKEIDKTHAFTYQFYDEQLADSQGIFSDVLSIVGFVALIAIVIAGMGLLGMATYSAETKVKEIGIRKVLGASVRGILFYISKSYVILLAIAILIAAPISYYLNNLWLQFFAIRVNFNFGILAFGILILLIIGLLAIGSQAVKAALSDPVNTLRDE